MNKKSYVIVIIIAFVVAGVSSHLHAMAGQDDYIPSDDLYQLPDITSDLKLDVDVQESQTTFSFRDVEAPDCDNAAIMNCHYVVNVSFKVKGHSEAGFDKYTNANGDIVLTTSEMRKLWYQSDGGFDTKMNDKINMSADGYFTYETEDTLTQKMYDLQHFNKAATPGALK